MIVAGDLVQIHDLQSRKNLNGQHGIVKKYREQSGRFEIVQARGHNTLGLRPQNITPVDDSTAAYQAVEHSHCAFWPNLFEREKRDCIKESEIKVLDVPNWPSDGGKESDCLKETFGWKDPHILGGVTRENHPKPDFMMYYDANDVESPINAVATCVAQLLPKFELSKVPRPACYRGVCVLIYCPMISELGSGYTSMGFPSKVSTGPKDAKFSLQQLRQVLHFHTTSRATAMYRRHDNPQHRLFGDL